MAPKPRRGPKGKEQSDQQFEKQSDHNHHSPAHSSAPAQTQPQPLSTLPPTMRPTGSMETLRPGELSRRADLHRRRPVVSPSFSSPRPVENATARHLDFGAASLQPPFQTTSLQPPFQASSFRPPPFVPHSTVPHSTVPSSTVPQYTVPSSTVPQYTVPSSTVPQSRPIRPPTSHPQPTHVPQSMGQDRPIRPPTSQSQATHVSQSTPAQYTPSQTTPTEPTHDADSRAGEASTSTTPRVRELDPSGLWFHSQDVVRSISSVMKTYFRQPWRNYTEVDRDTKEHWWSIWKRMYTWRPELEGTVKKSYEEKAALRLKDTFYGLVRKTEAPIWLGDDLLQKMKDRVKDPKSKKKSAQAKANRRGGNATDPAPPSHCQGSVSTIHRAKQLEVKEGKKPNAAELYLDTHFKKHPGREPQPVSKKAAEVLEKYTRNISESQASGTPVDPNVVFFETVGGFQKGEVHGFGRNGASLFYEKSSRRYGGSDFSPSVSAQLTQLTEELVRAKAELAERDRQRDEEQRRLAEQLSQRDEEQRRLAEQLSQRDEEQRRQAEKIKQQDAYMVQMKAQMDAFMRQFGDPPPFPGRFSDDDRTDGSGASGAFVA